MYPQYEVLNGKVADSADLHPVLASIYKAADFAPLDSTTAVQAAGMVELLCGLLHPEPEKRVKTKLTRKDRFPWLHATFGDEMPLCPVAL